MNIIRAIRAAITAFKHSLFEPQSNVIEPPAFDTYEKYQEHYSDVVDAINLAFNNSSAMTREQPLSDESKQWIAKDTCSGREIAAVKMVHAMHTPMFPVASEYVIDSIAFDEQDEMSNGIRQLIAHQQKMMEQSLKDAIGKDIYSESSNVNQQYDCMNKPDALISNYIPVSESVNHTDRYSMQSISQPCSTAHTPTAEPQAQPTPTDTPTVKGVDV